MSGRKFGLELSSLWKRKNITNLKKMKIIDKKGLAKLANINKMHKNLKEDIANLCIMIYIQITKTIK